MKLEKYIFCIYIIFQCHIDKTFNPLHQCISFRFVTHEHYLRMCKLWPMGITEKINLDFLSRFRSESFI